MPTSILGAGLALYLPKAQVKIIFDILHNLQYIFKAAYVGMVEESPKKQVVIEPKNLIYSSDSLAVR